MPPGHYAAPRMKNGPYPEADGCWEAPFFGCNADDGKGYFRVQHQGKKYRAHRLMLMFHHVPLPAPDSGLVVDHICRNRSCCRPDHLRIVTIQENTLAPGSLANACKTHCPQGHEYSGWNVYTPPSGGRYCRECINERGRAYRKRRKQRDAQREAA